jgi:rRNA maturation RNase YbeY
VHGAPGWRAALPRVDLLARRAAAAALADQGEGGHLTLLLTDDGEIRRLNGGFRGREKATNVLSFPAGPGAGSLGDIAVSLGVVRREAAAEGRALAAHFAHLVIHGTLHLLGPRPPRRRRGDADGTRRGAHPPSAAAAQPLARALDGGLMRRRCSPAPALGPLPPPGAAR